MSLENKIKEFQQIVGVKNVDGVWGGVSQTALDESNYEFKFKDSFIDYLSTRTSRGPTKDQKIESIKKILETCNKFNFGTKINPDFEAKNPLYIGYIMATAYHETAHTMYPISEYGKGLTRPYGKILSNSKGVKYGYRNSKKQAYLFSEYPFTYYGRGLVQLTWLDNYITMSGPTGIDLAKDPEKANDPQYASIILIYGMMKGSFTGVGLPRYIKYGYSNEFINARRIVNGTDAQHKIAGYVDMFIENLELIKMEKQNEIREEKTCKCRCECGARPDFMV